MRVALATFAAGLLALVPAAGLETPDGTPHKAVLGIRQEDFVVQELEELRSERRILRKRLQAERREARRASRKAIREHRKATRKERRAQKLRRALRSERRERRELQRRLRGAFSLPISVRLGRSIQALGFRVSEHPYFDRVDYVHSTGSLHYPPCSCALDVNWLGPNEPLALDRLAARLRRAPALRGRIRELLWRVPGHYDHLHIAVT